MCVCIRTENAKILSEKKIMAAMEGVAADYKNKKTTTQTLPIGYSMHNDFSLIDLCNGFKWLIKL